jgi:hypothetical protein
MNLYPDLLQPPAHLGGDGEPKPWEWVEEQDADRVHAHRRALSMLAYYRELLPEVKARAKQLADIRDEARKARKTGRSAEES